MDSTRKKRAVQAKSDSETDGPSAAPATTTGAAEAQPDSEVTRQAARDKMLLELRLKLNEARKRNHEEVVAEDRREHGDKKAMARERWQGEIEKQKKEVEAEAKGIDLERKWFLDMTIEQAEELERKKKLKEKGKAAEGWDVFNQDTLYKAYKKRVKETKVDADKYEKQKQELGERFYDPKEAIYGPLAPPAAEAVDKLVDHLEERRAKQAGFSRRRAFNPDKDVDFINERNHVFNKKISRAFDKYTQEIRDNLERGTAL